MHSKIKLWWILICEFLVITISNKQDQAKTNQSELTQEGLTSKSAFNMIGVHFHEMNLNETLSFYSFAIRFANQVIPSCPI